MVRQLAFPNRRLRCFLDLPILVFLHIFTFFPLDASLCLEFYFLGKS